MTCLALLLTRDVRSSYVSSKVASTPDSSIFDSIYNTDHIGLINFNNTLPSTSALSSLNSTDPIESIFWKLEQKCGCECAPKKLGRSAKTDKQKAEDKRQRHILSKK